ncbi:hypothetical protein [Isoptericola sp. b408]|uniref:hypothetical protein n=1 Tax=Isoptericola sp. b408 TaxID=3064653 RepID=UPI0027135D78|nr:hypothetical protein [Isoptericola sp. b408]MDO8150385.1 hypothetical protein [Isoptericola sp. b408]
MKKVLLAGGAVALGDGVLLGTTIALGWTVVAILLVGAGIAGATLVAVTTPAPRAPARASTVTLGLPLRDPVATESADEADAVATTGIVPEAQVAEPAAVAA